jgi:hypothetical protein
MANLHEAKSRRTVCASVSKGLKVTDLHFQNVKLGHQRIHKKPQTRMLPKWVQMGLVCPVLVAAW